MAKLSTKEIVAELLRTYREVTCTLNAAGDWIGRGPGSRYLDRPGDHDYHQGSYRVLEWALVRLRAEEPSVYAQVANEYLWGDRRTVDVRVQRKAKNNRTVTVVERRCVPVYPSDETLVSRGIAWIADTLDRENMLVQLPQEIYAHASA